MNVSNPNDSGRPGNRAAAPRAVHDSSRRLAQQRGGIWPAVAARTFDHCALCGEPLGNEAAAEMYDAARPDLPAVLCHGQCGLDRGLVVA